MEIDVFETEFVEDSPEVAALVDVWAHLGWGLECLADSIARGRRHLACAEWRAFLDTAAERGLIHRRLVVDLEKLVDGYAVDVEAINAEADEVEGGAV